MRLLLSPLAVIVGTPLAAGYLVAPPGTAFPGTISTCSEWVAYASGMTCASIESTYGITAAEFATWVSVHYSYIYVWVNQLTFLEPGLRFRWLMLSDYWLRLLHRSQLRHYFCVICFVHHEHFYSNYICHLYHYNGWEWSNYSNSNSSWDG
jgi:hypothetical protein